MFFPLYLLEDIYFGLIKYKKNHAAGQNWLAKRV